MTKQLYLFVCSSKESRSRLEAELEIDGHQKQKGLGRYQSLLGSWDREQEVQVQES